MRLAQADHLSESYPLWLRDSYPAIAASIPTARNDLVAFAAAAGADAHVVEAVRLASSEALTNVVLHAYGRDLGYIHVTAWVVGAELCVLIGDDGVGLRPHPEGSGLGLGLGIILQSSYALSVLKRSSGGTELRIRFRLDAGRDGDDGDDGDDRGSLFAVARPASPTFSTTSAKCVIYQMGVRP